MPLLTGMGLAGASGLNLHLPLLILGLANRFTTAIHLPAPYDVLSHPAVLIVLGVLCVVEFLADKIPAVDHAYHSLGVVLHPVAGAVVFLATTQGHIHPAAAALLGVLLAGTAHGARAALRPVSTAGTGGAATPAVSLVEDTASASLSLAAVFVPVVAGVMLIALAFVGVKVFKKFRGRRAARA